MCHGKHVPACADYGLRAQARTLFRGTSVPACADYGLKSTSEDACATESMSPLVLIMAYEHKRGRMCYGKHVLACADYGLKSTSEDACATTNTFLSTSEDACATKSMSWLVLYLPLPTATSPM